MKSIKHQDLGLDTWRLKNILIKLILDSNPLTIVIDAVYKLSSQYYPSIVVGLVKQIKLIPISLSSFKIKWILI